VSGAPEHCDWEKRLQDWIDGDLDPAQFAAVDEHIASCISCRAQMNPLQAVDVALSRSLSQATLDESFDCKVLERIASAAKTDSVAARARIELEWQDQVAALSDQWRNVWKAIILNAVAGVAVLIALTTAFVVLPPVSHLIDRMLLLSQSGSISPTITLSTAAGLTVVALLLVRSLASTER
jgi:anti-sigma factor RsiW